MLRPNARHFIDNVDLESDAAWSGFPPKPAENEPNRALRRKD
jgi:hypothetical protein